MRSMVFLEFVECFVATQRLPADGGQIAEMVAEDL